MNELICAQRYGRAVKWNIIIQCDKQWQENILACYASVAHLVVHLVPSTIIYLMFREHVGSLWESSQKPNAFRALVHFVSHGAPTYNRPSHVVNTCLTRVVRPRVVPLAISFIVAELPRRQHYVPATPSRSRSAALRVGHSVQDIISATCSRSRRYARSRLLTSQVIFLFLQIFIFLFRITFQLCDEIVSYIPYRIWLNFEYGTPAYNKLNKNCFRSAHASMLDSSQLTRLGLHVAVKSSSYPDAGKAIKRQRTSGSVASWTPAKK